MMEVIAVLEDEDDNMQISSHINLGKLYLHHDR